MNDKNIIAIPSGSVLTKEQTDMIYRLAENVDKFIEIDKLINEFNILASDYFECPVQKLTLEIDVQNNISALTKEIEKFKKYKEERENT